MQIHQLQPNNKKKDKKRIGRGGKKGTYSGKGVKGQKSRAGRKLQPPMRELIERYPKLTGYRNNPNFSFEKIVNLVDLEKHFKEGETINIAALLEKKMVKKIKGRVPQVKVLSKGGSAKKFVFEGVKTSQAVKDKAQVKVV